MINVHPNVSLFFNVYWFFLSVENVFFCVELDWWCSASRKVPTHFYYHFYIWMIFLWQKDPLFEGKNPPFLFLISDQHYKINRMSKILSFAGLEKFAELIACCRFTFLSCEMLYLKCFEWNNFGLRFNSGIWISQI